MPCWLIKPLTSGLSRRLTGVMTLAPGGADRRVSLDGARCDRWRGPDPDNAWAHGQIVLGSFGEKIADALCHCERLAFIVETDLRYEQKT